MPRTKGSKNKGKNINGNGGDRRSMAFKLKQLEDSKRKAQFFEKRMSSLHNNITHEIKHPLCEENITHSQKCLKEIINHPSMPQSSNISNYCTVTVTENEDIHDNNNYIIHDECAEKSIENDNTVNNTTYFRMRYIVPKESPLGIYLDNFKIKVKK